MPNRAVPLSWNPQDGAADISRRTAGAPARKLNQHVIVQAAFRVADADGFDGVTIRRVAAELGSPAASLYAHIAAKTDLLALMANELVGLTLAERPLPDDWREALSDLSRRMHTAFAAHPWAIEIFARRPPAGPNAVRRAKQLARAVAPLGLDADEVWTLLAIIDDYIMGNLLRSTIGSAEPSFEKVITAGDLVEFPELATLSATSRQGSNVERFETGLQTVLDGIERRFVNARVGHRH